MLLNRRRKKTLTIKLQSQGSDKHLQALLKAIRNCGVCFNVWEKLNGDGKGSVLNDFISVMGSDEKLLLKKTTR